MPKLVYLSLCLAGYSVTDVLRLRNKRNKPRYTLRSKDTLRDTLEDAPRYTQRIEAKLKDSLADDIQTIRFELFGATQALSISLWQMYAEDCLQQKALCICE